MRSKPRRVARALISVSDKTGLLEFVAKLHSFGIELISTGGTAQIISQAGYDVTQVSEITKGHKRLPAIYTEYMSPQNSTTYTSGC